MCNVVESMTTRIHMVGPISSEAVYQLALRAIDSGLTIPQQAAVILERELLRPKRRQKPRGNVQPKVAVA